MPSEAENLFTAAAELGRIITERRRIERQQAKDARNARRRARYAATKHLRPAKATTSPDPDEEGYEPECRCHLVAMPPCSYCTDLTEEEWEAAHAR